MFVGSGGFIGTEHASCGLGTGFGIGEEKILTRDRDGLRYMF